MNNHLERYQDMSLPKQSELGLNVEPEKPIKLPKNQVNPRIEQYEDIISKAMDIFEDRNRVYKDAFVVLGLVGTLSTLIGDCMRLRNMVYHSPDHGRRHREIIEDKLQDVINQAVISLMMLYEDNYEGK